MTIIIANNSQSGLHSQTKRFRHCDKGKNSLKAIYVLQREPQFCLLLFLLLLLLLLLLLASLSFAVCATTQSPLHIFSQESGAALTMNKITLGITRDGKRKSNYQTII
jgi:hypothetical protein